MRCQFWSIFASKAKIYVDLIIFSLKELWAILRTSMYFIVPLLVQYFDIIIITCCFMYQARRKMLFVQVYLFLFSKLISIVVYNVKRIWRLYLWRRYLQVAKKLPKIFVYLFIFLLLLLAWKAAVGQHKERSLAAFSTAQKKAPPFLWIINTELGDWAVE